MLEEPSLGEIDEAGTFPVTSAAEAATGSDSDDMPHITPVKPRRSSPTRIASQGRRTPSLQDKPIPDLRAPDSGDMRSPAPNKAERSVNGSRSPSRRTSNALDPAP